MLLCTVYKSPKLADTYIYVKRSEGLERVPDALMDKFGEAREVLTFKLTPERKLGLAIAERVLEQIASEGFYLQMPPKLETLQTAGWPESGTR